MDGKSIPYLFSAETLLLTYKLFSFYVLKILYILLLHESAKCLYTLFYIRNNSKSNARLKLTINYAKYAVTS